MTRTGAIVAAGLLTAASAMPAAAEEVLLVEFQERATGDNFRISNVTPCEGVVVEEVSINLATAEGALFFDVASGGPGYEDEPAEGLVVLSGAEYVSERSRLEDGGKVVTLDLDGFGPGAQFRFALDVDDRSGRVPGPDDDASARDMAGTTVALESVNAHGFRRAEVRPFGERGRVEVSWQRACEETDGESAGVASDS